MRTTPFLAALLTLALGGTAVAQETQDGARITGVVLDESGRPLADAEVHAFPGEARAHTDSTGRFVLTKLDAGFYHVRARRIGYSASDVTTDLSKDGHVDIKFELKRRPAMLDSVVVQEHGNCPALSYLGFNCRKRFGKGVYLTDDDLADKGAVELGEVFGGVEGFRLDTLPTIWGQKPVPRATHGGRCLNALVNGKPYASTNQLPRYATELLAVEIYALPNDVPPEYSRYVWMSSLRQTNMPVAKDSPNARCSLVVYWTSFS